MRALSSLKRGSTAVLLAMTFIFVSCGEKDKRNPSIPGVQGPILESVNDGLLVSMVIQSLSIDIGLRYEVPEYEESYIEMSPDLESGGTLLAVFVSYVDVFDNGNKLRLQDPQTLPGGRLIPGISGGRLPAVAFQVEELGDTTFYLGKKIYGVFIPVDLGGFQGVTPTIRFYSAKSRVGNIVIVGEDQNGENSGFALFLDLNSKVAKRVKKRR